MSNTKQNQTTEPGSPWVPGWAIGPLLFGLAAWFLWGPNLDDLPNAATPEFDRALLSAAPRRVPMTDPPTIKLAGNDATCMHCHTSVVSKSDKPRKLLRHQNVKLNHGPNVKCSTCHAWENRDKLAGLDGSEMPYADVVDQCGQCHVRKRKDWDNGIHGRTNGFWDSTAGERKKLTCTECHDPHHPRTPAMSPVTPLPGPNTLRMHPNKESHK